MEWMYDQLFDGRRLDVLAMIDNHSGLCLVIKACRQATAIAVLEPLKGSMSVYGMPRRIRCNGSQFVARETDLWAYANGVVLDYSRPGKPTDNAYCEAFNVRSRAECLNQHWFLDLANTREKVEDWRVDYNEVRPHSAIGDRPPMAQFRALGAGPKGSAEAGTRV